MSRRIPLSELPVNADGSVFHLHLLPEQLADRIMMMGDPDRVPLVASFFDTVEFDGQNREFRTITGSYRGKRITALSHGIGCDNLDIVVTELDALANIDLKKREVKPDFRSLTMVRMGTCGTMQPFCPIGSHVVSEISMGMDGLIFFYDCGESVSDAELTQKFTAHTQWNPLLARPYFVRADKTLVEQIGHDMVKGITLSASGFYGPQGRHVRLALQHSDLNRLIESFEYKGLKISNYEMESAALAGLSRLMGHRAVTVCLVVSGRYSGEMNTEYKASFDELTVKVLERI